MDNNVGPTMFGAVITVAISIGIAVMIALFIFVMVGNLSQPTNTQHVDVSEIQGNIIIISQDDVPRTGLVSVITFKDDLSTRCVVTDHGGTYCYSIEIGK